MSNGLARYCLKLSFCLEAFLRDEGGQDLIEYALVVSLVALAAAVGMPVVASAISTAFTKVSSKVAVYTS